MDPLSSNVFANALSHFQGSTVSLDSAEHFDLHFTLLKIIEILQTSEQNRGQLDETLQTLFPTVKFDEVAQHPEKEERGMQQF